MTTIQINEKTKTGKNILKMLKALSDIENENSIRFLDETEYLLSTKTNKARLVDSLNQARGGEKGKTIAIDDLWK